MEQVNITIGPVTFDHADFDAENDVLYLHVGEPQKAEGEETPEGHVLRYAPGTQSIVGLTVLGAQRILDRDGELRVTIPEMSSSTARCDLTGQARHPGVLCRGTTHRGGQGDRR